MATNWDVADIPDLRERTFVVTGANSGLGAVTTRVLANAGGRGHTDSFLDLIMKITRGFAQSAQMGALSEIYAATGPVEPGGYYGPKRLRGYPRRVRANAKAGDPDVAAKLRELSEKLTGVKFPI